MSARILGLSITLMNARPWSPPSLRHNDSDLQSKYSSSSTRTSGSLPRKPGCLWEEVIYTSSISIIQLHDVCMYVCDILHDREIEGKQKPETGIYNYETRDEKSKFSHTRVVSTYVSMYLWRRRETLTLSVFLSLRGEMLKIDICMYLFCCCSCYSSDQIQIYLLSPVKPPQ